MPKIAKPLTEAQLKNAKPRDKTYKLFDGGGLYVEVPVVGSRRWRFKYQIDGREKLISLGVYPEVSLAEARERRDDARKLVRNGQDPSAVRKAMKPETIESRTFRAVAEEWLGKKANSWTPSHVARVRTSLEHDAYPALGGRDIATIQIPDMLAVLRSVESRGALDVAARVGQRCANVFRYAILTGLCASNPASELSGVVKQRRVIHRAALARVDIPEFLGKLESYDGRPETRIGLRLLMLTFVRTGELRGALWSEIDLDAAEWRIPAERMKMREPHVVPLSRQTLSTLKELKKYTSWSELLFPGTSDGTKPMSENTMLYALYRMGYHGRATGHGFRALASTCLNELGWNPDVIERQLAHAERNKVRAAYNRASYMQERRKMMQAWADYIDAQAKGAKVLPMRRRVAQTSSGASR